MKKLLLVLGMVTCMFLMPVSGTAVSAAENYNVTEDMLVQYAYSMIESMNESVDSYKAVGDYEELLEEIGEYQGIESHEIIYEDGIKIKLTVIGTEKNGIITISLDESLMIVSIDSEVAKASSADGSIPEGSTDSLIVLVVLIVVIAGASIITSAKNREPKEEAAPAGSQVFNQIAKSEERTYTEVANTPNLMNDTQLVAVIAAAIAAYEGSTSAEGYVVRSLRKRR